LCRLETQWQHQETCVWQQDPLLLGLLGRLRYNPAHRLHQQQEASSCKLEMLNHSVVEVFVLQEVEAELMLAAQ